MRFSERWNTGAPALLAAALLAVGAAACGSGDDDGADASDDVAQAERDGGDGSPQAAIRATYGRFIGALQAKDANAACATLTRSAQKEFGTYDAGSTTCERALVGLMATVVESEDRPQIVELDVKGSKARANVRPAPGQSLTGVRFVNQDGEWKIAGSAIAR